MGNPSPLRLPSDFGSLNTIPEVVRYVSAFAKEVSIQFNNILGNKDVWGALGISGAIGTTGSGNFIPSLVATGIYWVRFREPYFVPPTVLVAPTDVAASVVWALQGVTNTGFQVNIATWSANTNTNNAFHFLARGPR